MLYRVDFGGFQLTVDDAVVDLAPVIEQFAEDAEEGGHEWSSFAILRAHVHRALPQTALDGNAYMALREPAFEALSRTLRHLRATSNDPRIDTVLRSFRFETCVDDAGQRIKRPDTPNIIYGWEFGEDQSIVDLVQRRSSLDDDAWEEAQRRVQQGILRTDFGDDLLLDARAALHSNDYRTAIVMAAITAEYFMGSCVARFLRNTGKVSVSQADNFVQAESNRRLPTLLQALRIIDEKEAGAIAALFTKRNAIVHAKQKKLPTRTQANEAIDTAQLLAERWRRIEQG